MTEMFAEDAEFMNTLVEQIGIMPSLKDLSVLESYRNTDAFLEDRVLRVYLTVLHL